MNEIRIGWGEADITPDGPVSLSGQYYPRTSTGIHSRLKTVALAAESSAGDSAVMVSVDVCAVPLEFQERVRERVKEMDPEIERMNIFLSATHTHSAPALCNVGIRWFEPDPECIDPDEYGTFVCGRIAEAVVSAWKSRRAGGISTAEAFAPVGHCRRSVYSDGSAEMYGNTLRPDFTGMEGNEDSTIELLVTFDGHGVPTGTVLNIVCPSQVMEATYEVSSDYMGRVRELLIREFGPEFKTLCQIGAAGCQSPRDLVRMTDSTFWGAAGVDILAKRVVDAVCGPIHNASGNIDRFPEFSHSIQTLSLPVRQAREREYREAVKELSRLEESISPEEAFEDFCRQVKKCEQEQGMPGPYDSKLHSFVLMQNAEAVIRRYGKQKKNPSFEIEHHVLRIGDAVFVTCPFELFLDYGHRIKARSEAEQVFIVQLACGSAGYLPTQRAEQLGGYGALIINGKAGSDGGARFVESSVQAIQKMEFKQ